jgi:hypothetical protein
MRNVPEGQCYSDTQGEVVITGVIIISWLITAITLYRARNESNHRYFLKVAHEDKSLLSRLNANLVEEDKEKELSLGQIFPIHIDMLKESRISVSRTHHKRLLLITALSLVALLIRFGIVGNALTNPAWYYSLASSLAVGINVFVFLKTIALMDEVKAATHPDTDWTHLNEATDD